MFEVITIGTATKDVFLISKNFKLLRSHEFSTGVGECFAFGSKVAIDEIYFDTGGGATNAAATFANLGFSVSTHTRVGNDINGKEILDDLRIRKVNSVNVHIDTKERTGYSTILSSSASDRTILVYRGTSNNFDERDVQWSKMKSKYFYISSVGGDLRFLKKVFDFAKKQGTAISWNPGGKELSHGMKRLAPFMKQCDFFNLNLEEARRLTGSKKASIQSLLKRIHAAGQNCTAITDGAAGAYASDRTETLFLKPPTIKPVNTTGAGDAFGAAFTAGRIKGLTLERCLQLAILNSHSVVRELGAKNGLLKHMPTEVILARHKVKKIHNS